QSTCIGLGVSTARGAIGRLSGQRLNAVGGGLIEGNLCFIDKRRLKDAKHEENEHGHAERELDHALPATSPVPMALAARMMEHQAPVPTCSSIWRHRGIPPDRLP